MVVTSPTDLLAATQNGKKTSDRDRNPNFYSICFKPRNKLEEYIEVWMKKLSDRHTY